MAEGLGGKKAPGVGSIAQLTIENVAFGGKATGSALFK
jgi:hypothetical protein